jgi:hypothetical protein
MKITGSGYRGKDPFAAVAYDRSQRASVDVAEHCNHMLETLEQGGADQLQQFALMLQFYAHVAARCHAMQDLQVAMVERSGLISGAREALAVAREYEVAEGMASLAEAKKTAGFP